MKKLAALLLALLLVCGMTACGGEAEQPEVTDESWSKIETAKKLVLGFDSEFPPMGFKDTESGDYIGFDLDIAAAVCEKLGIELELKPIDWNMKLSEINNGNVDCLWNGFSKTPDRESEYNLSFAYMKNNQIILVKTDSAYNTLADLAGKSIGVQDDSSALAALNDAANADFKASLGEVITIGDYAKAVLEIQNGTIDAIAIDEIVARFYLEKNPGAYRILANADGSVISLAIEDYVVGFRKADLALTAKIEEALSALKAEGKLAEISQKWFAEDVITVPDAK